MTLPRAIEGWTPPQHGALTDRYGRVHTYLRVSVTDRCNYRCTYCMPAAGLDWMPRDHLLTFEEITRVVSVFAAMGVRRVRLTGGEPTVRRGIIELVQQLGQLELDDLAMTTNGHLFAKHAEALTAAGLRRINMSMDSVGADQFRAITRGGDLSRVLAAIDAAIACGLTPVKINAVVVRGVNDDQVDAMVDHFAPLAGQVEVRFIEYMPFGGIDDRKRHVPATEMRDRLAQRFTLETVDASVGAGPATHLRLAETGLRVGFISPITEHFCQACNRLRLQADGHLRTCLSREAAPSLRTILRDGASDAELEQVLRARVGNKVAGHEAHLEGDAFRAFDGVMTSVGG